MHDSTRIDVKPKHSSADEPLTAVSVSGLQPGQKATITTATEDEDGIRWISKGTFLSDLSGTIDVSQQAPIEGTFNVPDPSAILWAMRPDGDKQAPVPNFAKRTVAPMSFDVTVSSNGVELAATTITRSFGGSEGSLRRETVDRNGLKGTLFYPADGKAHPVVICLSGSGGGISEPRASLIAAQGYTTLALGYFGMESLPGELCRVPLEFFERALDLLGKHESADCSRLAVYGFSKGGELALLLGSLYNQVKAVAAFSGSAYVWQGLHSGRPDSSWTKGGEALPFIPMKVPFKTMIKLISGRKVAFRESYERGLRSAKNLETATIPVEQINGPVFFVGGTDDQVWPAADYGDTIEKTLKEHKHPCKNNRVEGAGHLVGIPFLPSAETAGRLVFTDSNINMSSLAVIRNWQDMIAFFKKSLFQVE